MITCTRITPAPVVSSYDAVCTEVRARWTSRVDGDLMLAFLDGDGGLLLVLDIDEGTRFCDELFLRYVAFLVADLALPRVVACVPRADGRPLKLDRRLWRELCTRLEDVVTEFDDLLVVGDERRWSAKHSQRASRLAGAA